MASVLDMASINHMVWGSPQLDMLKNAQGWMGSLEAKARHATVGTWFSNTQRQQIVDTCAHWPRPRASAQAAETVPVKLAQVALVRPAIGGAQFGGVQR